MNNNIYFIIAKVAKTVGVSSQLLFAICQHESMDFHFNYTAIDKNTPSYGFCQVKYESVFDMGFRGDPKLLINPEINAYWAAKYLKHQLKRYNNNSCMATAAYNAGSYIESTKKPGYPKNLKYVKLVQGKLDDSIKQILDCGPNFYQEQSREQFP